jgi:hypothetical protein
MIPGPLRLLIPADLSPDRPAGVYTVAAEWLHAIARYDPFSHGPPLRQY